MHDVGNNGEKRCPSRNGKRSAHPVFPKVSRVRCGRVEEKNGRKLSVSNKGGTPHIADVKEEVLGRQRKPIIYFKVKS